MAALAVALEQRQERLHAMHDAHQIDVDRPAPILQRNIVSAAGAAHTGVIAQDMHLAEGVERGACAARSTSA